MSKHIVSLVYRKTVGSMARKAILNYCADRANDDGSGIWASKTRIALEVECSKRTVIDTIKGLCADGLMREAGKRKVGHGYVVVYAINVRAVSALPNAVPDEEIFAPPEVEDGEDFTGADLHPCNQFTPRGETGSPQEVKPLHPNLPLTVLKPSLSEETIVSSSTQIQTAQTTTTAVALAPTPKERKGTRLPENWVLPRAWGEWALAEGWPADAIRTEAIKFRNYWTSKAGKDATKINWERTFQNWMLNSPAQRNTTGGHHGSRLSQTDRLNAFINGAD